MILEERYKPDDNSSGGFNFVFVRAITLWITCARCSVFRSAFTPQSKLNHDYSYASHLQMQCGRVKPGWAGCDIAFDWPACGVIELACILMISGSTNVPWHSRFTTPLSACRNRDMFLLKCVSFRLSRQGQGLLFFAPKTKMRAVSRRNLCWLGNGPRLHPWPNALMHTLVNSACSFGSRLLLLTPPTLFGPL